MLHPVFKKDYKFDSSHREAQHVEKMIAAGNARMILWDKTNLFINLRAPMTSTIEIKNANIDCTVRTRP
jgi:hypothetical protein